VELFLDVSCPWCHGALTTVRRLLDEVAGDPDLPAVRVRHRFIRLHDMKPPEGIAADQLYASFGMTPEQIAAADAELGEFLDSVGVRVDPTRQTFYHNPLQAHRLLAMVRDDPGTDAPDIWSLARAVWNANFVLGAAIDDVPALRAAITEAGLTVPQRIWDRMADPQDHLEVTLADRARALEVSLDGVPRFCIGEVIVPAWKPIDEVRTDLRAALSAV
jgi:predicted DsbA family dithiol-disulfide isomerase